MRSLERRLLVSVLTTVTAGFAIVGAIAVSMVSAAIEHEFDSRLRGVAAMLAASAEFTQAGDFVATRIPETAEYLRGGSGSYWMIATDERILSRSRSLRIEQLPLKPPILWDASVIEGPGGRRLRAVSIRYAAPRLPVALTITATGLQDMLDADIRDAVRRLILALGAGAVLTALATAIAVRRALRPLAETANAIPRIADGQLPALPETGYREIDALVGAVNDLLSGARAIVTRSRLASANLAHALKTPLAALRSRAALIAPDDRELAADVDRLDRQIERHLGRVPHLLAAPMLRAMSRSR